MSVLRRAYVEVEPDVTGFDDKLREKFQKQDPGGKAGKQLGGQLNRALKRLDLDAVDVRADPKKALAAIGETERKLRELSRNASTIEIKVRAEEGLREISRFRKKLGDVGDDPEVARNFAARFAGRLGPLLASMPISGPIGASVAAAGAAAAPLLGAAIAGGIIGGVGIGGVIGGLTVASKDARVKAAADEVGDRLQGRLYAAAGAFIDPAIAGLKEIERAIGTIDLGRLAQQSAQFVAPLSAGAASAITDIGDALERLTEVAGPPVRAIADGLALIGSTAGEGLSSLDDNAEGAADALNTLFTVIGYGITTTFRLVNGLTELYELNRKLGFDFGLQLALKAMGSEMDKTGESARRTGEGTFGMSNKFVQAALTADELKAKTAELAAANDRAKAAQDELGRSLDSLGGKNAFATRTAAALGTAMDNLYGAAIRNTDANEAYQASWDELSSAVKSNKATLDIHSAAGRANRDVLEGLLSSNNDLYIANVAAGQSVDSARRKHEARTVAITKEAEKLGLNKKKTRELIDTYGQIPGKKSTNLVVDGINQVVIELKRVYLAQRALAEGKTINAVRYEGTAAMRSLHTGGYTGDGGKYEPKGIVHGGEWVLNKEATTKVQRQAPGFLDELNATGQLPGYARGGLVAPVETSPTMRFPVNVRDSYVMPLAEALKRVAPVFGNWPSSPSAQRGDSGVWRKVLQLIRSTGPVSGSFGNAYRPGDPKWHGSGRAVDWMGFNQDALASFLAAKRPLELIHRTKKRDYAYTRGKNKGSFNNALMEAHRNHVHIAMANGGVIREPVLGIGASGKSYSFGEGGRPETVTPGIGGGGDTFVFERGAFEGAIMTNSQQAEDLVVAATKSAKRHRRLP